MYIFGPVPSRRLGISLGVDLLLHKTCSLDCVYCECGETTNLTICRKSYVPLNDVLQELDETLGNKPHLDYITFSGSGEPTLSTDIGKVIQHIRKNHSEYKIALLTNGTLLTDQSLREELLDLDLIVPSIDAISEDVFQEINHPHKDLIAEDIINGMAKFRKKFKGEMWIEVFILPGINEDEIEIEKIKNFCLELMPNKVQLNTLDRPAPHNDSCIPVSYEKMVEIKNFLLPLQVDIITKFKQKSNHDLNKSLSVSTSKDIIGFLRRRPATAGDISESLDLRIVEVNKFLRELEESKLLCVKNEARGKFYYIEK